MYKRTLTYTDFKDNVRTEDFYFHLSKAELIEMELITDGGMTDYIEKIVKAKNQPEIVKIFKRLLLTSYGKKSEDGRRFMKSEEISREFQETEAYSILFTEFATDAEKASEFINGIIPEMTEDEKKQFDEYKKSIQPTA